MGLRLFGIAAAGGAQWMLHVNPSKSFDIDRGQALARVPFATSIWRTHRLHGGLNQTRLGTPLGTVAEGNAFGPITAAQANKAKCALRFFRGGQWHIVFQSCAKLHQRRKFWADKIFGLVASIHADFLKPCNEVRMYFRFWCQSWCLHAVARIVGKFACSRLCGRVERGGWQRIGSVAGLFRLGANR